MTNVYFIDDNYDNLDNFLWQHCCQWRQFCRPSMLFWLSKLSLIKKYLYCVFMETNSAYFWKRIAIITTNFHNNIILISGINYGQLWQFVS